MKDMAVVDVANIWRYNILCPSNAAEYLRAASCLALLSILIQEGSLAFKTAA
jgi:hypothetical protein